MPYSLPTIGRLRYLVETPYPGTFGTDQSANMAAGADLTWIDSDPGLGQVMLPNERVVSRMFERPLDELGFKGGSFNLGSYLLGCGQTLSNGIVPVKTAQTSFLEAIVGGYASHALGGSLVASAPTTTGATCTAAQGVRFPAGTLVAIERGATGVFDIRKVSSAGTDIMTWSIALSAAPSVGGRILNAQLLYQKDDITSSLQLRIERQVRDDIWLLMGCQGDLSLDFTLGAYAKWSSAMQVTKWLHDDDTGTPAGGAALASPTLDGSAPVPCTKGGLIFTPAAGTVLTYLKYTAFSVNLGIAWMPITAHHGIEGRIGYQLQRFQPTATFTLPFEDRAYYQARDAQTKYQLLYQAGSAASRMIGLELPTVQITDVQPADAGGLKGMTVTVKALEDDNAVDKTTEQRRTPYRIFT